MSPIFVFFISLGSLLMHCQSVYCFACLEAVEQSITELKKDPILSYAPNLEQQTAELTQHIIGGLKQRLEKLYQLLEDVELYSHSKAQHRLRKPTKMALRYCDQLLKRIDHFGHKAKGKLLDGVWVRIRSLVTVLPVEFGTLRIELELENIETTPQSWASLKMHCDTIDQIKSYNDTKCSMDHLQTDAKDHLLSVGGLLEKVGQAQRDISIPTIQEVTVEFIVKLKFSILNGEFGHKIVSFAEPCIYGKEFVKFSEEIGFQLKDICQHRKGLNSASKKWAHEQIDDFISMAQLESMPLKKKIIKEVNTIFEKTKNATNSLINAWQNNPETSDEHKTKTAVYHTKEILQVLSADLQIVGIQCDDINQALKLLDKNKEKMNHPGNVVAFFYKLIGIIGETIEKEKKVISDAYQFNGVIDECLQNGTSPT